jgi:hypothetical protein
MLFKALQCLSLTAALYLLGAAPASAGPGAGHITFQWGEEYELPKRHEDLGFLGNSADGYIQLGHRQGESLSFQKFDPKLHLSSEKEADISNLPRDYSSEYFTQLGDKYYWFFSTWEKGEGKETLYAQEVDVKTGGLKGSAREILSTTKLGGTLVMSGWSGHLEDKWNFYHSFDKKQLLIEYRKKPERRDDSRSNDVIGFHVFDENLQKVWGREIRMPYTEKKMDNEDYQVDRNGNVYTLAKVYNEEDGDRKHPDYRFEILKWSKDQPQVTKIPFRFTDKFVSSALILEDEKGGVFVSGLYSRKRKSNSSDGVFLLKLDPNSNEMSSVMKGTYEFPASLLTQFESARKRRRLERKDDKDEAEETNLVLRDVRIGEDGSIQIIGEEYFVEVVTYYDGKTTHTTYYYHYNDIMAMTLNSDGSLRWAQKIPKAQVSATGYSRRSPGDMGFKSYNFGGDTYFFFMDRESNMELDQEHAPDLHNDKSRGVLVSVKVDQSGKMSKSLVFNGREEKVRISPMDFDEVGGNQLIVRGRARHNESQAALITFE